MINASKKFRDKLRDGTGTLVNYADITLANEMVLHLGPPDIMMVGGCKIEDKTSDGKFGVGFCIGKTLTLRIANYEEQFSEYDFYGSVITVYVGMELDGGNVEKIKKGVYYTTVPETPGNVITLSAVDAMYKLDVDYSSVGTIYPAKLQDIISDICVFCGIPIGFGQFDNKDYQASERPEKATCRQVLSWACQIAGYNARIDNDGYMQLIWYDTDALDKRHYDGGSLSSYPDYDDDTDDGTVINKIDGGNFTDYSAAQIISGGIFGEDKTQSIYRIKSLTVGTDDVVITGVSIENEETSAMFGEDGYIIAVKGNPFVAGHEQEVANYLGQRMVGVRFRPFSAQNTQNPLYEPFDVCRVTDRKGNIYYSLINHVSYTVGSYTVISCDAESPARNNSQYVSEAAQAVVEARRNTEKQLTSYDLAVQEMNRIAINAMGYYTTYEDQEDGSRITYMHDKPNLTDSQVIYKMTAQGFFWSQDGGQSYTAGIDARGNAVMNILSVIGLNADWINTGRIAVTKNGQTLFWADYDTGEVGFKALSDLSSEFSAVAGKVVLKAGANGKIVAVRLDADPATGTEFSVTADNITLDAARNLRLLADKIAWNSTNSSMTEDGKLTCTDANIRDGEVEISCESETDVFYSNFKIRINKSGFKIYTIYNSNTPAWNINPIIMYKAGEQDKPFYYVLQSFRMIDYQGNLITSKGCEISLFNIRWWDFDIIDNYIVMLGRVGTSTTTVGFGIQDTAANNYKFIVTPDTLRHRGVADTVTTQAPNVYIDAGGKFYKTSFVPAAATSAKRLKTNITTNLSNRYKTLLEMPIYEFDYTEEYIEKHPELKNVRGLSMMADDVEKIFPYAVGYDEKGELEYLYPHHLVAPMLKLIQNQHKEIQDLQKTSAEQDKKISTLEDRISKLEALIERMV